MASPEEMAAAMIANMKEKTGKTLGQWIKIAQKSKCEKHGQMLQYLKGEHGMTHGFANLVAHQTLAAASGGPAATATDLVAAQYSGAKAELKPIYDKLVQICQKFGKDVEVAAKKSYVSLRRSKQFAIVKAATRTRIDLGLNLKGTPGTERLAKGNAFSGMCTHMVTIHSAKDVDATLKKWLKAAYDAA